MNTSSILKALRMLFQHSEINKNYYVLAADEISTDVNFSKFPIAIIQNSDLKSDLGQHWVSYICFNEREYDYYDSYGKQLNAYANIEPPPGKLVAENCIAQQQATSFVCGMYAIYFVYSRMMGVSYVDFLNQFNSNTKANDMIVKDFIQRIPSFNQYGTYPCAKKCQTNLCSVMCSKQKMK